MAKKPVPQALGSSMSKPKPTIRFDMDDGLPSHLPQVNQDVTLMVKGKLVKVQAKNADYNEFDNIVVRPSRVTVEGGKKSQLPRG